uniref:Uncharacterized protein n=1 Tax=Oryza meridionalis TaxID=40149 RepID=A0A0E0E1H9_9ORYZ
MQPAPLRFVTDRRLPRTSIVGGSGGGEEEEDVWRGVKSEVAWPLAMVTKGLDRGAAEGMYRCTSMSERSALQTTPTMFVPQAVSIFSLDVADWILYEHAQRTNIFSIEEKKLYELIFIQVCLHLY